MFFDQNPSRKKAIILSIVILILGTSGGGYYLSEKKPNESNQHPEDIRSQVSIDKDRLRKELMEQSVDLKFDKVSDENNYKIRRCVADHISNSLTHPEVYTILQNDRASNYNDEKLEKKLTELASKYYKMCFVEALFEYIDFNVLMVDINNSLGSRVRVNGVGLYMMDSFVFKKDRVSTNLISVSINELERLEKIEIIDKCSNPLDGCYITIYGVIEDLGFEKGIRAKFVEIKS